MGERGEKRRKNPLKFLDAEMTPRGVNSRFFMKGERRETERKGERGGRKKKRGPVGDSTGGGEIGRKEKKSSSPLLLCHVSIKGKRGKEKTKGGEKASLNEGDLYFLFCHLSLYSTLSHGPCGGDKRGEKKSNGKGKKSSLGRAFIPSGSCGARKGGGTEEGER